METTKWVSLKAITLRWVKSLVLAWLSCIDFWKTWKCSLECCLQSWEMRPFVYIIYILHYNCVTIRLLNKYAIIVIYLRSIAFKTYYCTTNNSWHIRHINNKLKITQVYAKTIVLIINNNIYYVFVRNPVSSSRTNI